jgi:hypothetical protein
MPIGRFILDSRTIEVVGPERVCPIDSFIVPMQQRVTIKCNASISCRFCPRAISMIV